MSAAQADPLIVGTYTSSDIYAVFSAEPCPVSNSYQFSGAVSGDKGVLFICWEFVPDMKVGVQFISTKVKTTLSPSLIEWSDEFKGILIKDMEKRYAK